MDTRDTAPDAAYSEEELLSRLDRAEQLLAEAHQNLSAIPLSPMGGWSTGIEKPGTGDEKALAREKLLEGLKMLQDYVPAVQQERRRMSHNLIEIRITLASLYNDAPRTHLAETEQAAQKELDRVNSLYRRLLQLIKRIRQLLHGDLGTTPGALPLEAGVESDDDPLRPPDIPNLGALVTMPPQEVGTNRVPGPFPAGTPVCALPAAPSAGLGGLASLGPLTAGEDP